MGAGRHAVTGADTLTTLSLADWKPLDGTTYTLKPYEQGMVIETSTDSGITITVDPNMPQGYAVAISQGGTGTVTIAAGAGVTINSYGGSMTTAGQYAMIYLQQVNTNKYRLYGQLT